MQFKAIGQGSWQDIVEANGPTLEVAHVQLADGGNYRVTVANAFGTVAGPEAEVDVLRSGVVAWGNDDGGQIDVPADLGDVMGVAGGYHHSLALKADGTVVAWGDNGSGQCNVPAGLSGVIQVAAGLRHSVALKADGTVVAWGDNSIGQLAVPPNLKDVVQVSASGAGDRTYAVKADGTVVEWGDNSPYGWYNLPSGLTGVRAVAVGGWLDLALLSDGTVRMWGYWGSRGPVPADVTGVVAIAGGYYHGMALKSDGTVAVWGSGEMGSNAQVPADLSDVVAIAAGGDHRLALKSDGTLVAWGSTADFDSGNPTSWSGAANVPYGLKGTMSIAAGSFHNLAIVGQPAPLLALLGDNPMTVLRGGSFENPGAVARDVRGNDLSSSIVVTGSVDTHRLGTYLLKYSVTGDNGRTTTATRTVNVISNGTDDTPPVLTCPADMSLPAVLGCEAAMPGLLQSVTAVDDSGGPVTLAQSPAAGTVVGLGPHSVVITATDEAGNFSTCTVTVTVVDIEKPTITPPANQSVNTDPGKCSASNVTLGSPTTADNCAIASVSNNAPPVFPKGATIVTWTVTDTSGNTATSAQAVTVVDKEPPTITPPASLTVNTDPGKCSASNVALGTPTTADNCGLASVSNDAPTVFPKGTTIVSWTVTDTSGNSVNGTQTVTVVDTIPPVVTLTGAAAMTVECHSGFVDPGARATDACAGALPLDRKRVCGREHAGRIYSGLQRHRFQPQHGHRDTDRDRGGHHAAGCGSNHGPGESSGGE
jgi:Domain of unknown function (DUF5011)/Regulator of chromosome condensation (RCC1) repeat/HYR domain